MEISNKTSLQIIIIFGLLILICFTSLGVTYIGSTKLPRPIMTVTTDFSEFVEPVSTKYPSQNNIPTKSDLSLNNEEFLQKMMSEKSVYLTAREVQFDMPNNLSKPFGLSGYGEISDYYNYGYDSPDIRERYFCVFVTPFSGSYQDSWYIYYERVVAPLLYQHLLEGKVRIFLTAQVLSSLYKKYPNQGNMAMGIYAEWFK